jgi:ribosome-associated toxin RatA of RatAB toxin-antitoxin module
MHSVHRSVLVPFSPKQMFDLVADVESYPAFMPWCGGARVIDRNQFGMKAAITIDFHGLKQEFVTRNTHEEPSRIRLKLVDGPFSALDGTWEFMALGDQGEGCKVQFQLDYAFSSRTLEALVGPVFNRIASGFIDAFTQRAEQLYGG